MFEAHCETSAEKRIRRVKMTIFILLASASAVFAGIELYFKVYLPLVK